MSKEAQRVYLTDILLRGEDDYAFPIALPNTEFNVPKNGAFGEFHITTGPKPVIIGGEGKGKVRVRYVGFVQLTIWIPENKGTKIGAVAEDTFRKLFQFRQGRDSAGSTYKFGPAQDMNPQTKKGWECCVVKVPFQRDTVEPVQVTI